MFDGSFSPTDPLFYMHHAMIDRVWAQWQAAGNGNDFAGLARVLPRNAANQSFAPASRDQVVFPERWGRTVDEIMTTEPSTCVTYSGTGTSRMLVPTYARQATGGRGYKSPDVKTRVETQAARKKATEPEAYKESCQKIIASKAAFYRGGKHVGFTEDFIDNVYEIKKVISSSVREVLLEDVEDPEAVVEKPVDDVRSAGQSAYLAVGGSLGEAGASVETEARTTPEPSTPNMYSM